MKDKLPVLILILLSLAVPSGASASTWLTSVEEAVERASQGDRYILIDLYADWCGWCKVLEEKVFSTSQFREFTRDFVLLRVNVDDGAEGTELQARFGVTGLPTTLIVDARLVKIGTVPGFAPPREFIRKLTAELESHRQLLRYYERMRRGDDLEALRALAEELHSRGDGARAAAIYEQVERRMGGGTDGAAWLQYLIADAHRLGGQFDQAERALKKARAMSGALGNRDLSERIDLLTFHIAQDQGDCTKAVASLEHFLKEHPRSTHRRDVQRTLEALKNGDGMQCA
ncbi:MAG: thioredoxin fold domain-containing protein [bacterium]|nr:thioredoxin fold domain-containing protein [bacterium]